MQYRGGTLIAKHPVHILYTYKQLNQKIGIDTGKNFEIGAPLIFALKS